MEIDQAPRADPGHPPEPADPVEAEAAEANGRLWLRAITPLLQLRSHDADPSGRVQYAYDAMSVAACERVARILGSDLPEIGDDR